MSHANIYIRKENEAKWEAIADKSAWVNDRLHENDVILNNPIISKVNKNNTVNGVEPATKPASKSASKPAVEPVLCKHGYAPKLCRYAKNGWACGL